MGNIELIHQEAMVLYEKTFVKTFDILINQIVYPIFTKRFSLKWALLLNNTFNRDLAVQEYPDIRDIRNIITLEDCENFGLNCTVSLNRLDDTLNKFYRKFAILNKEYDSSIYSSQVNSDRYYGTLVANMNFQLDMDYEQLWHALKTSEHTQTLPTRTMFQTNVASFQLQNDLVRLLDNIISSQNISLTDALGLLGYDNIFGVNNMKSKTEISNGNELNCSTHVQSACRNSASANILHPLHGFDPMHMRRTACDLELYFERWNKYLQILDSTTNNVTPGSLDHNSAAQPCASIESESTPEVKSCCKLFDGIFNNNNIQQIMSLMKYSLDLSNPWISQYYQGHKNDASKQIVGDTRSLYKVWLAEGGDEFLNLLAKDRDFNFLQSFGYVTFI